MATIPLAKALKIISASFAKAKELGLNPLTTVVLDAGGYQIAGQRQDGASNMRTEIAAGKAFGALALGIGSRKVNDLAVARPHFFAGLSGISGGRIIPVPGGVLVRDRKGQILGAVGITGDSSENDEACAIAGIEAAGYVADAG